MARVSRKHSVLAPAIMQGEKIYRTCMYLRLSKENSGYDKDDSIEMQKYLLQKYVDEQPDMELINVFCDNGTTGTNFKRPEFEKMMESIRKRELDCIVVKDLSRFGRNYVETGYYLEKIFPFLNIRFVSINDNYDSLNNGGVTEMMVFLKNIINSYYAKDISKKLEVYFIINRNVASL